MDFYGIRDLTRDGRSVMEFLCKRYERTRIIRCVSCGSKEYTFQARGYLRCGSCRTDYNPFKRTGFKAVDVSMIRWMVLMYMFNMEASTLLASRQACVSYPATLKAFDHMRCIIINEMAKTDRKLRGVFGPDAACFSAKHKGRMAKNNTVMFGIRERRGKARIDIINNAGAKTLPKNTIGAARLGSITYTDKWGGYDSVVMAGYHHRTTGHGRAFSYNKPIHVDGIEGFWSYARQRLAKYHGVKPSKFLLYIKEMEWRYNNRNKDTFIMLLDYFQRQ